MAWNLYVDDRNIDRNISSEVFSKNNPHKDSQYFDEDRYLFSNQCRDLTNQGLYGAIVISDEQVPIFNDEFLKLEQKYNKQKLSSEYKSTNLLSAYYGNINTISQKVIHFYFDLIALLDTCDAEFNLFPVDILVSVGKYRFSDFFKTFPNNGPVKYMLYKYLYNFADLETRKLFVDFDVENYTFLRELKKDIEHHLSLVSANLVGNNVNLSDFFKDLLGWIKSYERHWTRFRVNANQPTGVFEEDLFFQSVVESCLLQKYDISKFFVDDGILKNSEYVFAKYDISKMHSENVPLIRACDMLLGFFGKSQTHVVEALKLYCNRMFSGEIFRYPDDDMFVEFRQPGDDGYEYWLQYHYTLTTIQDFFVRKIRNILIDFRYVDMNYPFWDDMAALWTFYTFTAFAGYDITNRDAEKMYAYGRTQSLKFVDLNARKEYIARLDLDLINNLYNALYFKKYALLWPDDIKRQ